MITDAFVLYFFGVNFAKLFAVNSGAQDPQVWSGLTPTCCDQPGSRRLQLQVQRRDTDGSYKLASS